MKHDVDNQAMALESTRGSLRRLKISRTLAHKRFNIRPEILATLSILFRPQYIAHTVSRILTSGAPQRI